MRLTIAYSKIKKRNLVLINNDTYQRETVSERPIRQPLKPQIQNSLLNMKVIKFQAFSLLLMIVILHEKETAATQLFELWFSKQVTIFSKTNLIHPF